ncbi:MAG: hypothetical protein QXR30_00355 [Candidatus Woesearchaeota archaeon]
MINKVIQKEPVTMAKIKEILEKQEKNDDLRIRKTLEYCKEFSKVSDEDAEKIKEELKSLNIARLNDEIIVKIIDIFPKTEGSLKAILEGFNVTLTKEQIKSILNILVKYL